MSKATPRAHTHRRVPGAHDDSDILQVTTIPQGVVRKVLVMRLFSHLGRAVLPAALTLSLAALVGGTAQAQVSPIGSPFVGDLLETWESRPSFLEGEFHFEPDPTNIFGGAASIANPFMLIYEPGFANFGIGFNGNATVVDGENGLGIDASGQTVTITFVGTVSQFGAFWNGNNSEGVTQDITITFFDSASGVIDTEIFNPSPANDNVMNWFGWSSPTPIKSISYTGSFVVIDSLRALSGGAGAPEPGTFALLTLGVVGGLAVRRKK